jgi:hypothetical protein
VFISCGAGSHRRIPDPKLAAGLKGQRPLDSVKVSSEP